MTLHWRIRTGSAGDFQKLCGSGLDSDWNISQSAHLCRTPIPRVATL